VRLATALVAVAALAAAQSPPPSLPRIRSIVIQNEPLFGPDERLEPPLLPDMTFIFDAANLLHIDTKEQVIRRELLVKEGDLADPALLEESERNLRAQPYIRAVRVLTEPAPGGEVDVVVRTQDTWTTQPRASFSSGGGTSRSSFGIVESNLLGYGKRFRLLYRSGLDRTSSLFEYTDPRVLGSRWLASGNYQDTSDGRVAEGFLDYPFYALATPWGGSAGYSSRREENRVFDHFGEELARFRRKQETLLLRAGHRIGGDDSVVWRAGISYRRRETSFAHLSPSADPLLLPPDRRESAPGVYLHREVIDYVRERHLNLFDRIEDLNLGNILDVEMSYSSRALDGLENEPIFTLADRQGFDLGVGRKAFLFGFATGRHRDGDFRNAVAEAEGIVYFRTPFAYDNTLVVRAKLDWARNLDRDTQLILGNFNGLRGFDTRQFVGEKRLVFNVEDRVFFVNDFLHLVSLGAVVFFDAGYVWDRNQGVQLSRMASSMGIGLRLDAPRGAGEALFRIDLAMPITDGGSGNHGPAVTFSSGQAFDAFDGPFDLQTSTGR
jgi:hemolysin activation/secretion protein